MRYVTSDRDNPLLRPAIKMESSILSASIFGLLRPGVAEFRRNRGDLRRAMTPC